MITSLPLFAAALVLFFVLNVADMILTDRVLELGGKESNPAVALAMRMFGGRWRLLKVGAGTVVVVALWYIGLSAWAWAGVAVLLVSQGWVVWHNYGVLRRRKGR